MKRLYFVGSLCAAVACLSGCAASRSADSAEILRVMTYNIHHGEGMDGKIDLQRIADLIKAERVDIVAMQEVDRGVDRSDRIDIMTELSDLTGLTYAFGKNIDYGGGAYGNGFLTRFPILEERNLHYRMLREGEQRGLHQLVVEVRGIEIVIMNTHLDYREDPSERLAHIKELKQAAGRSGDRPVILCGDFNDIPGSPAISSLKPEFADAWELSDGGQGLSYPTTNPAKRIDYVFFTPKKNGGVILRPRSARTIMSEASDHLPVVVEFEIAFQ